MNCRLLEGLSIRLSKGLSKGLSETAANIYKMIYADNYITRSDIADRIGISVTAVQKHINKLKSLRFIDRDGSTGHGSWIIIESDNRHIITVEGRSLIRTFLAGATKDAAISSRAMSKLERKRCE